jgi:hypothetical protein
MAVVMADMAVVVLVVAVFRAIAASVVLIATVGIATVEIVVGIDLDCDKVNLDFALFDLGT